MKRSEMITRMDKYFEVNSPRSMDELLSAMEKLGMRPPIDLYQRGLCIWEDESEQMDIANHLYRLIHDEDYREKDLEKRWNKWNKWNSYTYEGSNTKDIINNMLKKLNLNNIKMETEKAELYHCSICKRNYREKEDIDFEASRKSSKTICVMCTRYVKEDMIDKKQDVNINFYELLQISSQRMKSIYQDNLFKPSFYLAEPVSLLKLEFSKEYNGIFELLKEFASAWKLMTKQNKDIFCEFVVGKRLADELLCFMDILSARKMVGMVLNN